MTIDQIRTNGRAVTGFGLVIVLLALTRLLHTPFAWSSGEASLLLIGLALALTGLVQYRWSDPASDRRPPLLYAARAAWAAALVVMGISVWTLFT